MLVKIQEHRTMQGFQQTLTAVTKAIKNAGLTIFAEIDHAGAARENGLDMPETRVILYGNPKVGTHVMTHTPLSALDLPLRVLVRELPGHRAAIAFHPVTDMFEALGVKIHDAEKFDVVQNSIASSAADSKKLQA
ncbi:DUF302 domain-containing protein [Mesorhizobium sp. M2E.F.Ca.ET.209.01.1.1]|jgi:uncharacterized protein (DUF302 family)|uniref:DUF302 domain-containing protein n=1 Tax=Mesorhizobium sp. M2E.F.Ca.ET.209.01.1.1 TaxID=2500526 RepID=UPI000FD92EDE|nr:DUF302 domain-containing protein [Mesorhizobium sp. M2E.F.Ca.ET.209.01.1.1]TGS16846.1 DUF302 domain-containing protein [Mesorhizobium sp. M2E.F.Ca.ET.209.01.1.1]